LEMKDLAFCEQAPIDRGVCPFDQEYWTCGRKIL